MPLLPCVPDAPVARPCPQSTDVLAGCLQTLSPLFGQNIVDAAHDAVNAAALSKGNAGMVATAGVAAVAAAGAYAAARRVTRREPAAWLDG